MAVVQALHVEKLFVERECYEVCLDFVSPNE